MDSPTTHRRWALAFAALLAFALRWWNVEALSETPLYRSPHGDGKAYLELAARLREGGLAGLLRPGEVDYQAPLYPHVVALFQWIFGESLTSLRQFQAVLGAGSTLLLGVGATRLFGHRAGVIAALVLAVYAPAIWLDGLIQKSALSTFLAAAIIALWTFRSTRATIGLGVVVGLAMLTRGEARLLALVIGVGVALRVAPGPKSGPDSRAPMRHLAPYVAGLTLVVLPVFLRNGLAGGDWVLTTSQSGPNLFIGNQPEARGTYAPLVPGHGSAEFEAEDARELAEEQLGRALTPREVSSYWRGRAIDMMKTDPGAAVQVFARKALLAVNHTEVADTDDLHHARRSSVVLRWTLPFSFVLAAAAVGFALATQEERRRSSMLLALAATQWFALIVFFVFARYRMPMALFLMPLAGLGLSSVRRMQVHPGRSFVAAILALAISFAPVLDTRSGTSGALVNEAKALLDREDYARAKAVADEACELAPQSFETQRMGALTRLKLKQEDEAYPFLVAAHEYAPGDWQVRAWLGIAKGERGDLEGALALLAPAALERPEAMPIVSNAVGLAVMLGETPTALNLLRKRIAAHPDEPDMRLRLQLAWILSTSRDPALRDGEEALEVLEGVEAGELTNDVRAAALAELGQTEAARDLTTNAAHRAIYAAGKPLRE